MGFKMTGLDEAPNLGSFFLFVTAAEDLDIGDMVTIVRKSDGSCFVRKTVQSNLLLLAKEKETDGTKKA